MKIAEINMVDYGSTGKIMFQIAECARKRGHVVKTFSKKWRKQNKKDNDHYFYGTTLENAFNVIFSKLIGFQGLFSYFGTKQLVKQLKKFKPDVIHLHNLHDYSTCLPVLFKYIKKSNVQVVWTFHDCWPITGECMHFSMIGCEKWKTGCYKCKQLTAKLPIDCSKYMWNKKKQWFQNINNILLVTPSQWLADIVHSSYLKKYPIKVINNGIDLSNFQPTKSTFRKEYNIKQYMVLGVALEWGIRKGLDVMIELSKRLPKNYQIVLVGTNEKIDKILPKEIISIHRTHNQKELAQIYSTADVFVNPTREEVLGMVNVEALACGTPVVTFNSGGSPECLDELSGKTVPYNDINLLEKEVINICENNIFLSKNCIKRSKAFDMNLKFNEYVKEFEKFNSV